MGVLDDPAAQPRTILQPTTGMLESGDASPLPLTQRNFSSQPQPQPSLSPCAPQPPARHPHRVPSSNPTAPTRAQDSERPRAIGLAPVSAHVLPPPCAGARGDGAEWQRQDDPTRRRLGPHPERQGPRHRLLQRACRHPVCAAQPPALVQTTMPSNPNPNPDRDLSPGPNPQPNPFPNPTLVGHAQTMDPIPRPNPNHNSLTTTLTHPILLP